MQTMGKKRNLPQMKFLHLHSYDLKKHSVDLKPNKHQPAQTSMHVSKENSVN